jgi:hypothetical protein
LLEEEGNNDAAPVDTVVKLLGPIDEELPSTLDGPVTDELVVVQDDVELLKLASTVNDPVDLIRTDNDEELDPRNMAPVAVPEEEAVGKLISTDDEEMSTLELLAVLLSETGKVDPDNDSVKTLELGDADAEEESVMLPGPDDIAVPELGMEDGGAYKCKDKEEAEGVLLLENGGRDATLVGGLKDRVDDPTLEAEEATLEDDGYRDSALVDVPKDIVAGPLPEIVVGPRVIELSVPELVPDMNEERLMKPLLEAETPDDVGSHTLAEPDKLSVVKLPVGELGEPPPYM